MKPLACVRGGGGRWGRRPPIRTRPRCRVDLRIRMHPPPACVQTRGGEDRSSAGVHPPACVAPVPPGRRCRQGVRTVSRCAWVVVPASMRAGVQTRATLSRTAGGCGRTCRQYLVYLRCVFNMLSAVHEINPKSLGNPTDLGSAERESNNNKANKIEDNTMSMKTWNHRGRVSPDPQGDPVPNTRTLAPRLPYLVCVVGC